MGQMSTEGLQISPRLKNALVADLVMVYLGREGDDWLSDPLCDPWEWTYHLARQLGVETRAEAGGVHDTLLLIIPLLDELISSWPPQHDLLVCRTLAHEATKHLTPIEIYATLLAGPPSWRRQKIDGNCKVDGLAHQMQPLLEKALAAEINGVLARWMEWDIRKLRERRKEAVAASEAARARAAQAEGTPRLPYSGLTDRQRADRAAQRADRRLGFYQPPGRT